MATFLDVTSLTHFTSIFVFLFVWIVVYSVLLYTHALGTNQFINAIIGLLFAVFVVMSSFLTDVVATAAPIMAVLFVFVVLVGIASKSMGADMESFPALKGLFIIALITIIIISIAVKIRTNVDGNEPDTSDLSKTVNLVFHPKFIGMVLLFAVAIFTIALLAGGGSGHGGGHH